MTGWAQVRYWYGSSVDDAINKLQYDLYYVKNHTLFLDTVVLFETVRVVLTGRRRSLGSLAVRPRGIGIQDAPLAGASALLRLDGIDPFAGFGVELRLCRGDCTDCFAPISGWPGAGASRAFLLIAAVVASACGRWRTGRFPSGWVWMFQLVNLLDVLRMAAWFGFLLTMLYHPRRRAMGRMGCRPGPKPARWPS